jgi:hypothetical protein
LIDSARRPHCDKSAFSVREVKFTFLQRRQVITEVLDALLCGTLVLIVFEEISPRGHLARSVGRDAGSKVKDPCNVFVWKLTAVTFGQCGEIRGGYSKRPSHRAVALSIGSVTCGAILFVDLHA